MFSPDCFLNYVAGNFPNENDQSFPKNIGLSIHAFVFAISAQAKPSKMGMLCKPNLGFGNLLNAPFPPVFPVLLDEPQITFRSPASYTNTH